MGFNLKNSDQRVFKASIKTPKPSGYPIAYASSLFNKTFHSSAIRKFFRFAKNLEFDNLVKKCWSFKKFIENLKF